MKNVVFVMPYLGWTGAERVVFNLLNNLSRDKFRLHVLLYKNDDNRNSLVQHLSPDVTISYLNLDGRIRTSILKFVFGIRKYCSRNSIDTLFISDGVSNAALSPFLFLFGNRLKKIARESNLPTLFEKNPLVKFLYSSCYKNYDSIVVQSNEMYSDLFEKMGIPDKKLVKINNPVDIERIVRMSLLVEKELYPLDKINLLSIGRLTYQKGFDLLLYAFSNLAQEKYHLTLIGDGEKKHELLTLAAKLGIIEQVSFIDSTDNPYAYMKKADIFVSSSRWEGYPNVVIESIACGTPVISNDYPGGIREIINHDNGLICNIESELGIAINKVIELKNVSLDPASINKIYNDYESLLS
ncbi:TPA: glycosyltransferase [Serratia marcescens]|uniref:glycosyltransferase n=1 Tax=Serratia marcescens TaxID=615 RepID=UPI0036FFA30F